MNKIRNIFKIIVNYPSLNKCKIVEAIRFKTEEEFNNYGNILSNPMCHIWHMRISQEP